MKAKNKPACIILMGMKFSCKSVNSRLNLLKSSFAAATDQELVSPPVVAFLSNRVCILHFFQTKTPPPHEFLALVSYVTTYTTSFDTHNAPYVNKH